MHPIRVFITPLSAALVGTMLMTTPALAVPDADVDLPAETAARIGDQVQRACRTVARAEERVAGLDGGALPYAVSAGLKAATRAVAEAEVLADSRGVLAPGLARARQRLAAAAEAGRVSKHTAALLDDATFTLHALSVNSALVEAMGHLGVAAEALSRANPAVAEGALGHAEAALVTARARGGNHVAQVLDTVRATRLALADAMAEGPGRDTGLHARIAEVRGHLADMGVAVG